MRYVFIICLLVTACSSARKTINQQKQDIKKSSLTFLDSFGLTVIDTSVIKKAYQKSTTTTDSGYDKVVEEDITEIIDSNKIHRQTRRTIKEKGQKRIEQSAIVIQKDSTGKQIQEQATVKKIDRKDSSVSATTKTKAVKRITLLPWWIWLIVAAAAGLAWWKKNSIIDFFT